MFKFIAIDGTEFIDACYSDAEQRCSQYERRLCEDLLIEIDESPDIYLYPIDHNVPNIIPKHVAEVLAKFGVTNVFHIVNENGLRLMNLYVRYYEIGSPGSREVATLDERYIDGDIHVILADSDYNQYIGHHSLNELVKTVADLKEIFVRGNSENEK